MRYLVFKKRDKQDPPRTFVETFYSTTEKKMSHTAATTVDPAGIERSFQEQLLERFAGFESKMEIYENKIKRIEERLAVQRSEQARDERLKDQGKMTIGREERNLDVEINELTSTQEIETEEKRPEGMKIVKLSEIMSCTELLEVCDMFESNHKLERDLNNFKIWREEFDLFLSFFSVSDHDRRSIWEGKAVPDYELNRLISGMILFSTSGTPSELRSTLRDICGDFSNNSGVKMMEEIKIRWQSKLEYRRAVKLAELRSMKFTRKP